MSFDELRNPFHLRLGRVTQQKAIEFAHWFVRASTLPALHNNYLQAKWSLHLMRNLQRLSRCLYPCPFTSGLQPQLACLR